MATKIDERESVKLDRIATKYAQLKQARKDIAEMEAFAIRLEAEIQKLMKDAEVGLINGAKVVIWSPSRDYAWAQFRDANPDIYRQFLIPTTTEVLDKEALMAAHPGLLKPFQKRPFKVL